LRGKFIDEMQRTAPERSGAQQSTTGTRGTTQLKSLTGGTEAQTPLDPDFVEQTTSRLAVYLGPIAKIVARKAAQGAGNRQEFVQRVAVHLGTQERSAFLREFGFVEFE
jgi:eukaryotic-like serine/threonine-protein kinase